MKKSELKTGMNIYFKDGSYGTVLLGTNDGDIVASGGNGLERTWFSLDEYANDLSLWDTRSEVLKITQPNNNGAYLQYNGNEKLVWEPGSEKTYTIDELISLIKKATQ